MVEILHRIICSSNVLILRFFSLWAVLIYCSCSRMKYLWLKNSGNRSFYPHPHPEHLLVTISFLLFSVSGSNTKKSFVGLPSVDVSRITWRPRFLKVLGPKLSTENSINYNFSFSSRLQPEILRILRYLKFYSKLAQLMDTDNATDSYAKIGNLLIINIEQCLHLK